MPENSYRLNIEQIQRFIPHRQPFLLIDRILEIEPKGNIAELNAGVDKVGTRVVALKNVTFNEPYFQGHFPGFAIVPGVLLIEMMAQAASFSVYPYAAGDLDHVTKRFQCILVGVDEARFRKPVVPGDTLRIESVVEKCRAGIWGFRVVITVEGQKVAEANILANLILKGDVK